MKPSAMSKAELLAVLHDITMAVEADDSYEGSIEYGIPHPGDFPGRDDVDFTVIATYRIGNSQGQGGYRMVGEME